MLSQWAASKESGYMTFAWSWRGQTLESRPGLLKVFKTFNRTATQTAKPNPAPKSKLRRTAPAAVQGTAAAGTAAELHYTYGGPTSVTFDWDGTARTLRYGRTRRYGSAVTARSPKIIPFSSKGPFWQVTITRLKPGTTREAITQEAASHFAEIAQTMRSRGLDPHDRVTITVQPDGLIPGRRETRLRVIAAGLCDEDIDRLIKQAQAEAQPLIR